jgi:hypothetical protein
MKNKQDKPKCRKLKQLIEIKGIIKEVKGYHIDNQKGEKTAPTVKESQYCHNKQREIYFAFQKAGIT